MSSVGAAYITRQPRDYDMNNTFALMGNEHFLRAWKLEEENCECTGSHYTALTDTRLLLRTMNTKCCSCCCEPGHVDTSIFLRDISVVREATETEDCCSRSCGGCCGCCGCCCNGEKHIEIRGSFGSEVIHVAKADTIKVQNEIPAAIGNHKLVSQY